MMEAPGISEYEGIAEAARDNNRVSGLTHGFYRYPAGFSPTFARMVIQAFTKPGDLVVDPFMGGGTSLVEAAAMGRRTAGTDINSLAVFVSTVKTTTMTADEIRSVRRWGGKLCSTLTLARSVHDRGKAEERSNYQRHLNYRHNWRIRKLLEILIAEVTELKTLRQRRFARCLLLRTGQWALDCRKNPPSVDSFRARFLAFLEEMGRGALEFSKAVRQSWDKRVSSYPRSLCMHRSAEGLEDDGRMVRLSRPHLILTSPPYPGVHVLYHRWQVDSRRETAAPYWLAGTLDGNPSSYYTFCDRNRRDLEPYYVQLLRCFRSLRQISDKNTWTVQMVAFSDVTWQLPKYLEVMRDAGFDEVNLSGSSDEAERIYRTVPNRKWYAYRSARHDQSNEVVLVHRPR
jgi:hypothetical protein